jgi:hypothetical protein
VLIAGEINRDGSRGILSIEFCSRQDGDHH